MSLKDSCVEVWNEAIVHCLLCSLLFFRLKTKTDARKVIKEFSLKCRGLFGTEYIAQATALL